MNVFETLRKRVDRASVVGRYTDLALSGKTLKSRYLHCDLQNTTPSFNVYPGGNSHRHTEERPGPGAESSSIPLWWTLPINFLLKPERGPPFGLRRLGNTVNEQQ